MRGIRIAIVAILVSIVLFSCENLNIGVQNSEIIIAASFNDDCHETKTAISEVTSENIKFTWLAGDAINVFFGATEGSIFVTDSNSEVAQFKGTIGAVTGGGDDLSGETSLWGIYPYDRNTVCDGSSITLTLPHKQDAKADNLADDLFPSVARSTNFVMAFNPICGSISFKVAGSDIVKVTLSGNDNEVLAGKAKVSMELGGKPEVEEIADGQKVLYMTAPDGGCFEPEKSYYFVFYPSDFEKGLTLTYYKKDSYASFVYNNAYPVKRNEFGSISAKDRNLEFTEIEGGGDSGNDDEDLVIPIESIELNATSLVLAPNMSLQLRGDIVPTDATDKSLTWTSDAPSVVHVDDNGKVTAISKGTANVTAKANDGSDIYATCAVTVRAMAVADVEYVVDDISYGYGTAIGDVVWAPVNCGYKAPTIDAQGNVIDKGYPYGKLYQWGRKYGQGYSLEYDSTEPEIAEGPVSLIGGQHVSNSDKVYTVKSEPWDWLSTPNDALWNSGSEEEPKKTEYDPCPDGWRVPTYQELSDLIEHHSDYIEGQEGYFLSGIYPYQEDAPKVFFLTNTGYFYIFEGAYYDFMSYYWSSKPAGLIRLTQNDVYYVSNLNHGNARGNACSVRCVQE